MRVDWLCVVVVEVMLCLSVRCSLRVHPCFSCSDASSSLSLSSSCRSIQPPPTPPSQPGHEIPVLDTFFPRPQTRQLRSRTRPFPLRTCQTSFSASSFLFADSAVTIVTPSTCLPPLQKFIRFSQCRWSGRATTRHPITISVKKACSSDSHALINRSPEQTSFGLPIKDFENKMHSASMCAARPFTCLGIAVASKGPIEELSRSEEHEDKDGGSCPISGSTDEAGDQGVEDERLGGKSSSF